MTGKLLSFASALAMTLSVGAAHAGGIYVPGAGPQAQARAGAFVAKADDPSALFHNPAGFAKGVGTVILIGANLLDLSLEFTRAGGYESPVQDDGGSNPYPTVSDGSKPIIGVGGIQAIPILAVTTDLGLDLPGVRFAAGLYAPHGYPQRNFGRYDFEDPNRNPPPNRYDTQKQEVGAAFPSIGASYSLGKDTLGIGELDVGVRMSWGIVSLQSQNYVWSVRNYEENIINDGYIDLDVRDHFVPTFGVGILYRPIDVIEFGLAYSEQASVHGKGNTAAVLGSGLPALGGVQEELLPADNPLCEAGGEVGRLKTCLDFNLPRTASLGGRYILRGADGKERGDIEVDVKWEDWSAGSDFKVLVDGQSSTLGVRLRESIIAHGLRDTVSFRVGGAYSFPAGPGSLIARAGVAYDTEAADPKWSRLDIDGAARTTLGGGLAWQAKSYRIDVGAGAVLESDRTAPACNPDLADPDCAAFPANQTSPSPTQPLQGANNQVISPFNGGQYKSHYVLGSLGVTTWF